MHHLLQAITSMRACHLRAVQGRPVFARVGSRPPEHKAPSSRVARQSTDEQQLERAHSHSFGGGGGGSSGVPLLAAAAPAAAAASSNETPATAALSPANGSPAPSSAACASAVRSRAARVRQRARAVSQGNLLARGGRKCGGAYGPSTSRGAPVELPELRVAQAPPSAVCTEPVLRVGLATVACLRAHARTRR